MFRDGLDFKSATKQVVAVFPAYGPELWEAYFTSEKNKQREEHKVNMPPDH